MTLLVMASVGLVGSCASSDDNATDDPNPLGSAPTSNTTASGAESGPSSTVAGTLPTSDAPTSTASSQDPSSNSGGAPATDSTPGGEAGTDSNPDSTANGGSGNDPNPGGAGSSGSPTDGGAGGISAGGSSGEDGTAGGGLDEPGTSALSWLPAEGLWTAVRYYAGATPQNRTSGPAQGPTQSFVVTNDGATQLSVNIELSGPNADAFEIESPTTFPVDVDPGDTLAIDVRIITDNATLGTAPAQDDGATVLEAQLTATAAGDVTAHARFYGLVLTYVELEPTFGQIMDAFPYQVNLGNALENDANPNPSPLPGVEPGTDEVAAQTFQRANPDEPVSMTAIARFSPPGEVPYGYYPPGNPAQAAEVGVLAVQDDPHTNDKSRLLEPPLASGSTSFDPGDEPFAIFMQPDGVAAIYSQDAENADGQHRIKVFKLSAPNGDPIPNAYLLGGEEAANGDYQDYVFILRNVLPQ